MSLIYFILFSLVILFGLFMTITNIIKVKHLKKIQKDTEELMKKSEEATAFWLKKLQEEQKNIQKNMDIINREYYEYLQKKKAKINNLKKEISKSQKSTSKKANKKA